jgi:hypothetical protein
MTARSFDVRSGLVIVAIAAIWACVLALHAARPEPVIAVAGSIDLIVTATLVAYFAGARRGTVMFVASAGAIAARLFLLRSVVALAIALEAAALVAIAVRFRRARAAWGLARGAHFHDRLERALGATGIPARVADVLASEVAVVANALVGWRRRAPDAFTVHGSWAIYTGTFVGLTLVETPLVHLALVAAGAPVAAWILSALSLYGALWLLGDFHALRHGGVFVRGDELELRIGVRWRARIPRASIVAIARGAAPEGARDLSILGANVVITLAEPCTLHGLFGIRRAASVLALSLDDPDGFVATAA